LTEVAHKPHYGKSVIAQRSRGIGVPGQYPAIRAFIPVHGIQRAQLVIPRIGVIEMLAIEPHSNDPSKSKFSETYYLVAAHVY